MSSIDIQNVLAQMKVMAARMEGTETSATGNAGGTEFSRMLKKSIDAVNDTQQKAGDLSTRFVKGDPDVNLAQVMVALQKASVSFEAMTQVRNKLVDAYQEIMRMQI